MIREGGRKVKKSTFNHSYLNVLLRCIATRKKSLLLHHNKSPHKFSFEHRIANDQYLSLLYIDAEKELSRLFSISYSPDGIINVIKNEV